MSLKWLPLLIAPALLATACGGDGQPNTATPSPAVAMPSATPAPTAAITPAVQRIAYIGTDGDVWVVNADGSGEKKLFDAMGGQLFSLSWSPDGSKFAVTGRDDVVYIVAADGDMLLRVLGDRFLAWSPTSDMFAVARLAPLAGERTVFVLDSRGDTVIELKGALGAAFSADGERLAFDVSFPDEPGGLCGVIRGFVANIRTRKVKPIDPDESLSPGCDFGPAFSPSNPSLITYGDGLIDLESGNEKVLPGTPARWSPDGQLLLLHCGRRYCGKVYELETGALILELIFDPVGGPAPFPGFLSRTAWSIDSRLLSFFEVGLEPDYEPALLHIQDVVTSDDNTISMRFPASLEFSPESSHLLFSNSDGIWLLNADGTNLTLLADGSNPAWQPQP